MNITQDDLKFWMYEAQRTREFRRKCSGANLSIKEIMKEIDEDHIPIQEEPCKRKYPRIGDQYQVDIKQYTVEEI